MNVGIDKSKYTNFFSLVACFSGLAAALIGIIALSGWLFDFITLASLHPDWIPMAPSTAIIFFFFGLAIFIKERFYSSKKARIFCKITIYAIFIISALLLILSIKNIFLPIEHLGIQFKQIPGEIIKGHMSPITAVCFLLGAITYLLSFTSLQPGSGRSAIAMISISLFLVICIISLIIYVLSPPALYHEMIIPPAINTVLGLLLIGAAIVCSITSQNLSKEKFSFEFFFIMAVFTILTLGIAYSGSLYYNNYEKHFRMEFEKQISAIAELKSTELSQWRKERLGDAEIFFNNHSISELIKLFFEKSGEIKYQQEIQAWFKKYQSSYNYNNLYLINKNGDVKISYPDNKPIPSSFLLQQSREAINNKKIIFMDLYVNENNKQIYMTILIPILDTASNTVLGTIALNIDPSFYLYPFIKKWPAFSKSAETLLVRKDGNDVLYLNDLKFLENAALNYKVPLSRTEMPSVRAINGERGIIEGIDYKGTKVIADIRSIANSPWFMVSRVDIAEIYGPLRERLSIVVMLAGIIIFTSGICLNFLWQQRNFRFYMQKLEIESEKAWLKDIIERSLNEIYIFDPKTLLFKFVNTGAKRNIGYEMDELLKMTPVDIKPEYNLKTFKEAIEPLVNDEKEIIIFEAIHQRKNGSQYLAEVHLQLVKTTPEKLFLAIINDITERKTAENKISELNSTLEKKVVERTAQLESSNRELEAFAYSVSHDLRAPLRAIDGFSKFLSEDYGNKIDEEGKRLIGVIRTNAQKMDQLISDLLSLSKVSRSEINSSEIKMKNIATSVYNESISQNDLEKFEFIAGNMPDAFADAILIKQVWRNLISNAIKYTMKSKTKKIEIGGYAENNELIYYVKDSGAGFNPEYIKKLFTVFQRLHATEEFEGNGVGLAIVQRIISRHGGRVWAEGKLNNGASFYFSLPKKEII